MEAEKKEEERGGEKAQEAPADGGSRPLRPSEDEKARGEDQHGDWPRPLRRNTSARGNSNFEEFPKGIAAHSAVKSGHIQLENASKIFKIHDKMEHPKESGARTAPPR